MLNGRERDADLTETRRTNSLCLVPIGKWPICPISALSSKFYPRNINHMPAVKFFARLDLDQIFLFLDEHYLLTDSWLALLLTDAALNFHL